MSKSSDTQKGSLQGVSYGYGYVVSDNHIDRLLGKLFEVVEALGFQQKQEDALKGLVQKTIYSVMEDAIFIKPERHTEIREEYYKIKSESKNTPISAI